MQTIFVIDGNARPNGLGFAGAASVAMRKAVQAACDDTMTVGEWFDDTNVNQNPDVVPVLLTLASPAGLKIMTERRATLTSSTPLDTCLIDHPLNSRNRNKAGRCILNGQAARWTPGITHRPNRIKNDWDLQPWRDDSPRKVMHCPSNKQDEYACLLERDEATSIIEVDAIFAHLKQAGIIGADWEKHLRPWTIPGAQGGVMAAIRDHDAVIDGNSVLLIDALREGRAAIVWEHPGKPLAHTIASYCPLRLSDLENREKLRFEREPLFEFFDNLDVPFEALDNATLKEMLTWQLKKLPTP